MVLLQFKMTWNDITNQAPLTSNAISMSAIDSTGTLYISQQPPPTLLYNCNLPRGRYRAKITGLKIATGFPQNTVREALQHCANPVLFGIQSSRFHFPPSVDSTFWFSGNQQYSLGDYTGKKEFIIDNPTGNIDLTLLIIMFGTPPGNVGASVTMPQVVLNTNGGTPVGFASQNQAWTWSDSQFAYLLLNIDVEPMDLPTTLGGVYDRKAGFL